jgi:ISXO2-like transposase domain
MGPSITLIQKLQELGVLHSSMDCQGCRSAMTLTKRTNRVLDGLVWQCTRKSCGKRLSIRKNSWFSAAHLSISTQFLLIYCCLKYDKMLSKYIADIAGIDEGTVVDWGNYIREAISQYFLDHPLFLGQNHPVQIDESLFGGRCKYHRGDHGKHTQSWVFGMIEEVSGLNVLWMVDDRKRLTLTRLIRSHITIGATVKSDGWASYAALDEEGYKHLTVNHSVKFVSDSGVHTQLIESLWSQVKSVLKAKRGTRKHFLAGYLDLYSFASLAKSENKTTLELFFEKVIRVNKD